MMINSLYQLSNKGSLRTLSFILALFLTAAFFLNLKSIFDRTSNCSSCLDSRNLLGID